MDKNDKIKSISEAFSMQPQAHMVDTHVARIVVEQIALTKFCVGYDKENKRLFEYRLDSVNIDFE